METSLNDMSETNGLNEENLSSLKGMLHQLFHLEDKDLRTYSPLTLAYIGDGVYELVIRTILVKKGNCPVNQLHRKASSLVKAGTQSSMMEVIEPMLTERNTAFTEEEGMLILLQWPNMQLWQTTAGQQGLKL